MRHGGKFGLTLACVVLTLNACSSKGNVVDNKAALLCDEAFRAYVHKDFNLAEHKYQTALALLKQSNDDFAIVNTTMDLARVIDSAGKYKLAALSPSFARVNEKELFSEAFSDSDTNFATNLRVAEQMRQAGNLAGSRHALENALSSFNNIGSKQSQSDIDSLHKATCLFELAKLRLKEKDSDSADAATKMLQQCYAIRKSILWSGHPDLAPTCLALASALNKTKKWDDAAALIIDESAAIQALTLAEYREPAILAELQLAEDFVKTKDDSAAMKHAQLARKLAELDPIRNTLLLLSLEKIGDISFYTAQNLVSPNFTPGARASRPLLKNELAKAEDYYNKAATLLPSEPDQLMRKKHDALLVLKLASVHLCSGDASRSESEFKRAAEMFQSVGEKSNAEFCLTKAAAAAKQKEEQTHVR